MNQKYLQAALVWAKRFDHLQRPAVVVLQQFQLWLDDTAFTFDIPQEKLINLLATVKL